MRLKEDNRRLIGKFLLRVPVFKNLSRKQLRQIIEHFSILYFRKGETVFLQSDRSTELYILLEGKVVVTLFSKKGEEFILTELCRGDFFGELSLIDCKPRSASVIAGEYSVLAVLKRKNFLDLIKKDPTIAIALLETLVERLRKATEREERFAFLDVRDRLLKLLMYFIESEGKRDVSGYQRIIKRTHKELAARIGASREAVSKLMKELIHKKIVREEGNHYLIMPGMHDKTGDTSPHLP